jgi:outer membrane protein insertion porin family
MPSVFPSSHSSPISSFNSLALLPSFPPQGAENTVEGSVELRNVVGVADHWSIGGQWGQHSSRDASLEWWQPRWGGSDWTPSVRLSQAVHNQQVWSSYSEAMRGLTLGLGQSR